MILEKTENDQKTGRNSLYELLEEVGKHRMQFEDPYEIAAILESLGWSDILASEVYGVENVFELAALLWDMYSSKILFVPAAKVIEVNFFSYAALVLRGFLRGAIFALPMAVSVAAMLTLRFSLWSYFYLSLENATSIAIGTILSFVAVGGFTQAIAYWGFRFVGQELYNMARRLVFYFIRLGYVVCLFSAFAFIFFNGIFSFFPWRMTFITALYFLFLSAIWLSVTIMYILQKELTFTGLIISGIILVFIFFKIVKFNIILSQSIALLMVSLAGVMLAYYYFVSEEKKKEKGINPPFPRLSVIFHITIPYFSYGFLYFAFIFIDRVIAWSTNGAYMPFLIWFRGEYELGLDFALIVLILPMGFVEAVVTELMLNLEANQKNYMAAEAKQMNEMYVKMYSKRIIYVLAFAVVNAIALHWIIGYMGRSGIISSGLTFSDTTRFVFNWAMAAYVVLTVALMNALILFCLSRPLMAYRSILWACFANMALGFILSRWVEYNWAVLGLFAGSLVFVFFSSRQVLKVLKDLDYYLYSAI